MSKQILCTLTNENMMTRNHRWTLGVAAPVLPPGGELWGEGFYWCYAHPLLAVLLNPCHENIQSPRMFTISPSGERVEDSGLIIGYKTMTLLEEIELPTITLEQKVAFAILCAKNVHDDPAWNDWADRWLSGKDRSRAAAARAARAAVRAVRAVRAAWAAAMAAADAAETEAEAAEAANAAMAAMAAMAARAAMSAAARAARAAANAAAMAAAMAAAGTIDLIATAKRAVAEY